MAELEANTVIFLLGACLALLALALLLVFRISARLHRVERLLASAVAEPEPLDDRPSLAERAPDGAFERFLSEDPARRELAKGEQFKAFRQWRREQGMNWAGPRP